MITGKVDQGVQQYDDAFKKILKVAVESGGMSPTLQAEASGVDAQLKSLANSSAADIQRCVDLALASQYDTAIDSYVRVLQSIGSSVKRFSVLRGAPADSIDPKASGDAASAHLETIASMLSAARGVLATGDLQGAIARYKEAVDIGAQEEVIQPKIDSLEQSLKPAPPPPPPMAPPGEGSSPASGWGAPSPTVPSPSAAPAAGSAGWNAAPAQPAPAQPAPAQPVRVEVTPAPTPAAADEGFSIVPATTEWGAPAESASPAEPLPVEEEPEQDDEESEAPVPWGVETE
jgi:hypothetical protein